MLIVLSLALAIFVVSEVGDLTVVNFIEFLLVVEFIGEYCFVTKVKPRYVTYFLSFTNIQLTLLVQLSNMDGYLMGMIVMFLNVILLASHSFLENSLTFLFVIVIQIVFISMDGFVIEIIVLIALAMIL